MKAIVYDGIQKVQCREVPDPKIEKDDRVIVPLMEKVETALKLQGGSKSAIEIASQAVRKCRHVALVGVYGTKYNNFPLGNFFTRNQVLFLVL